MILLSVFAVVFFGSLVLFKNGIIKNVFACSCQCKQVCWFEQCTSNPCPATCANACVCAAGGGDCGCAGCESGGGTDESGCTTYCPPSYCGKVSAGCGKTCSCKECGPKFTDYGWGGAASGLRGHTAVVYNNKMYVYGGNNTASTGTVALNTLRVYDFSKDTWSMAAAAPDIVYTDPITFKSATAVAKRYGHTATIAKDPNDGRDKMYVFGGYSGAAYLNTLYIYDFVNNTWSLGSMDYDPPYQTISVGSLKVVNMPAVRYYRTYHSATLYNNKIYVFGGTYKSGLNTVRIYDIATNRWSSGLNTYTDGTTISVRRGHTALVSGTKMYVFGGYAASAYLHTMDVYDFGTGKWSKGTPDVMTVNGKATNQIRGYHSGAIVTGSDGVERMYIYGGSNGKALNSVHIYNFSTGSWSAGTSDVLSYYHSMVSYGGELKAYGGYGGTLLNTIRSYDLSTDTWSSGARDALGGVRAYHSSVYFNNKMYVFGGMKSTTAELNTMRIYDFGADSWSSGPSDITQKTTAAGALVYDKNGNPVMVSLYRYGHSAVVYGSKMYVFGGNNGSTYLNTMRIFDFSTGTWSDGPSDTVARAYHSAVVYGTKMFVYGGRNSVYLNTVSIYDFVSNQWSAGTADVIGRVYTTGANKGKPVLDKTGKQIMDPLRRGLHSAVVYGTKMIVFAGFNGSAAINTMRAYDLVTQTWSELSSGIGLKRYGHRAEIIDNMMYVFGGYSGGSLNVLEIYDLASGTPVASEGESDTDGGARHYFSSVLNTNNGNIYVFGGLRSSTFLDTLRMYDPASNYWSSGIAGVFSDSWSSFCGMGYQVRTCSTNCSGSYAGKSGIVYAPAVVDDRYKTYPVITCPDKIVLQYSGADEIVPDTYQKCSGSGVIRMDSTGVCHCTTTTTNVAPPSVCIGEKVGRKRCSECFDPTDDSYVGVWGACNPTTHKRARTSIGGGVVCREDCTTSVGPYDQPNPNVNDCADIATTEDCMADISGYLFDATDLDTCPADVGTNIAYSSLLIKNGTFDMVSPFGNWPAPNSAAGGKLEVKTNANGFYKINVWSPGEYFFDWEKMTQTGEYVLTDGKPKLVCNGVSASASESPSNCDCAKTNSDWRQCVSQPCAQGIYNFGFEKVRSGWWQAQGGSVFAEKGVKSVIPSVLAPGVQQALIASDVNGRSGILAYGELLQNYLGSSVNTVPSANKWEVQASYLGQRYDYDYFVSKMSGEFITTWDGNSALIYAPAGGKDYQVLQTAGDANFENLTLEQGQKMIVLVPGNVTVKSDVVVPDGAFLMVVAKGDITVESDVTTAQGWYVAENIRIPCNDSDGNDICDRNDIQFVGQGSFVGWSGIFPGRDRGVDNSQDAPSKFIYRRDFMLNVPQPIKNFVKTYKQIRPEL